MAAWMLAAKLMLGRKHWHSSAAWRCKREIGNGGYGSELMTQKDNKFDEFLFIHLHHESSNHPRVWYPVACSQFTPKTQGRALRHGVGYGWILVPSWNFQPDLWGWMS
jgi:hypothetical protein